MTESIVSIVTISGGRQSYSAIYLDGRCVARFPTWQSAAAFAAELCTSIGLPGVYRGIC